MNQQRPLRDEPAAAEAGPKKASTLLRWLTTASTRLGKAFANLRKGGIALGWLVAFVASCVSVILGIRDCSRPSPRVRVQEVRLTEHPGGSDIRRRGDSLLDAVVPLGAKLKLQFKLTDEADYSVFLLHGDGTVTLAEVGRGDRGQVEVPQPSLEVFEIDGHRHEKAVLGVLVAVGHEQNTFGETMTKRLGLSWRPLRQPAGIWHVGAARSAELADIARDRSEIVNTWEISYTLMQVRGMLNDLDDRPLCDDWLMIAFPSEGERLKEAHL